MGGLCDIKAIMEAWSCGCRVIATIHGESIEDIINKSYLEKCIKDKMFKRFIFVRKDSMRIIEIYDENLCRIA